MEIYYFDNAATSWPKPRAVMKAMQNFCLHEGGNPGRSGHVKAIGAGKIVLNTRERLAELFNISDSSRIVFTKNATEALNIVLLGILKAGDHVIAGSMEHNSVLRPLTFLEKSGVEVSIIPADAVGLVSPESLMQAVRDNTRLIAITHASNVTGTVNDIGTLGRYCRGKNIRVLVDAAQTAGTIPIDVEQMPIDFLAFSGHKGLLGPQGTGGLYIRDETALLPLMRGGTGSLSDLEEQPEFLPDRYESGTLNVVGLSGLGASCEFLLKTGVANIMEHDRQLLDTFLGEFSGNSRVQVYGAADRQKHTGVLSLNIHEMSPSTAGELLEQEQGILTRIGLHCAPRAHKTIGTFPDGTVRFSWGYFTEEKDVVTAVRAIIRLAERSVSKVT
ncbi:MAG: aminotransferase class V-fold PLP-dependent enzyme [bacterium]|nr:aminotransferase class V-fold PLP-dependent enzyme [bacterium]